MEDNSKLFVFEKKEVFLIFAFILVLSITAFTLGIRVGKQLSLKKDGYSKNDIDNINLKSVEEEYVDNVVNSKELTTSDFRDSLEKKREEKENSDLLLKGSEEKKNSGVDAKEIEDRLKEEMEKLAISDIEAGESTSPSKIEESVGSDSRISGTLSPVKGKYTIQLYSNQAKSAAEDFADPFIIKGHNVIINEVVIPGKGTWYRVSIGIFDSAGEAKEYLNSQNITFQNEDYIIAQF